MSAAWYESDLNRLVTLLNTLERGGLAIALCEDRKLRDAIMNDLRPRLTRRLHEFTLSPDANDPIYLLRNAGAQSGDVACFYDLEASGEVTLKILEWRREAVWDLGVNLLFWVTGEGQRRLLADAPNFYSRRTLLVQFTSAAAEVVTLMFADVVEPKHSTFSKVIKVLYDEYYRDAIIQHQQRGHSQGGEFLTAFSDPSIAVWCAIDIQKECSIDAAKTADGAAQTRIGIHTGTLSHMQGTLGGADVDKTKLLTALGNGGQILLSAEAYNLARDRIGDVFLYSHGAVPLTGFSQPQEIYEVLWEGHYPQPLRRAPIPTNLPPHAENFVGRRAELERVAAALGEGKPVVLLGEAGVGKTVLALEAAHSAYAARRFVGGVAWVNLENNPPLDCVFVTIARALSVVRSSTPSSDLRAALDAHLHRVPCLLVLDCVEAVVRNAELWEWVNTLPLSTAVMVTTRDPLPYGALPVWRIEWVDALPPHEAVTLFIAQARIRLPNWNWESTESETLVSRIVEFCGGNPLAIQLTAALVGELSLQEISEQLQEIAQLSTKTSAPALTHERALRASLDWTYQRLGASTQAVFASLSLFADTFTAEAVAAVRGISNAQETLDRLQTVALLSRVEGVGHTRYVLHPFMHSYAAEKFATLDSAFSIRQQFVTYFYRLVVSNGGLRNLSDPSKLAVLDHEWHNALAAAEIAKELANWEVTVSLWEHLGDFLILRGLWSECERLTQQAHEAARKSGDHHAEERALYNLGTIHERQGRWAEAEAEYQESLAICRKLGDRLGEGQSLMGLANIYNNQDRWAEAEAAYQQSVMIFREFGDRLGEGQALLGLGNVYKNQQRWTEAEAAYQQSLSILREIGDRVTEGQVLNSLGNVLMDQGRLEEAETIYQQGLAIRRELGDRMGESQTLTNLGNIYASRGQWTEAEAAYQQSLSICRELRDRVTEEQVIHNLGTIYANQKRWTEAEAAFQQSLEICRDIGTPVSEGKTLESLALLRAAQGDVAGALELEREVIRVLETTEDEAAKAKARELVSEWERQAEEQKKQTAESR